MNPEQIKSLVADAIAHRTAPPEPMARAKYGLWIDTVNKKIGCGWTTTLRLQKWQHVVYTFTRHPDVGFTVKEWDDIAERFEPYFL